MPKPQFSNLIESQDAFKILKNDVKSGVLSHAYLFCSHDRLAVSLLSTLFAADAVCGGDEERKDLVYANKHADVIKIPAFTDTGEQKTSVLTADIDALIARLYLKPVYGDRKFYIIDYGETMNASCQNKLLKSLEEPPPSVHFIINTASKASILPTVISRCKEIPFLKIDDEKLKMALKEAYPLSGNIDLVTSFCGGSLQNAVNLALDKKFLAMFKAAMSSLLSLNSSKNILFASAQLNNYKDKLPVILEFYEMIFRDALVYNSGAKNLVSLQNYSNEIELLSGMFSIDACTNIMEQIAKANKRLKTHGNQNSIIDELLFSIVENRAKYK